MAAAAMASTSAATLRARLTPAEVAHVAAASLVDALMVAAFPPGRPARSAEYRYGVRAALMHKALGAAMPAPFPLGSAAFDAFHAGVDEGKFIWTRRNAEEHPA